MNKKITLASLAWCLVATVGAPALAADVWFTKYDVNGDGLWDYSEFVKANDAYYVAHPQEVKVTTKVLRQKFDDLDVGHTGVIKVDSVRTFHTWD